MMTSCDTLDDTLTGDHDQIFILFKLGDADHRGDLFIRGKRQDVGDIDALALAGGLGDLITLDAIDASLVGEEQVVVVGVRQEHFRRDVLITAGHARDASAASALGFVGVMRQTLDVTELGHRDDAILLRDEVFDIDLAGDGADLGTSGVAVFIADLKRLFLDDRQALIFAFDDLVIFFDLGGERGDLVLDLRLLHVGQLTQSHADDRLSLDIIQTEALT